MLTPNKLTTAESAAQHGFSFSRLGGIDQATLQNDEDWQNLDKLDPQLWMALSCPIQGLEFDAQTLTLLDTDNDGRIRAQEVKEAVAWICRRLKHPSRLTMGRADICLEDLRDDTPEGMALAAAVRLVLEKHSREQTESVSLGQIDAVVDQAANYPFNGDGVVTLETAVEKSGIPSSEEGMAKFIGLGLAIAGGKKDASGKPGLTASLAKIFTERVKNLQTWRQTLKKLELPLGEDTGNAWVLVDRLRPKFDDFFYRCQLAAFAPDTIGALNEENVFKEAANSTETPLARGVDRDTLLAMPLSRVNPQGELNLETGLNPAWQEDIGQFVRITAPLWPAGASQKTLTAPIWKSIWEKFTDYAATIKAEPSFSMPPEDAQLVNIPGLPQLTEAPADDPLERDFLPLSPNDAAASLSDKDMEWILSSAVQDTFASLVNEDLAAPPLATFLDLRKLALFSAHLYTFLMNFLAFIDFYDPQKKAIFQTGVLYLDSRACLLCVPVTDVDAHARLAEPSHLCLIYCACTRKEKDGSESSSTISAALTQGTLAGLLEGRHGLFIDNDGKEWDTRIIRIVHNPVSLSEAMWSPYIRVANMAGEQINKFVSSKDAAIVDMTAKAASSVATTAKPPVEAAKSGFDFAKGAGIFAALGVALSAVSAAFAYIAHSLASLGWWWPLAILLVFVCISGPSMFLAWIKLRRRTLGPLLDASGWAVNQGAPINLPMGASLTSVGKLPPNAIRNLDDPYSLPGKILRKKWKTRFWLFILLLLIVVCGSFALYCAIYGEPVWLFRLRALSGI